MELPVETGNSAETEDPAYPQCVTDSQGQVKHLMLAD